MDLNTVGKYKKMRDIKSAKTHVLRLDKIRIGVRRTTFSQFCLIAESRKNKESRKIDD